MRTNRAKYVITQLVLTLAITLSSTSSLFAGDFLYAETTATLSYSTYIGPIPITGLSLNLPAASSNFNTAVVTLNMPNLFLSHPTSKTIPMAATFQIVAPFSPQGLLEASGGIGCDTTTVKVSGIKPLTMVFKVPLGATSQLVEAEWASNGTSTVTTQTFASLSAILVKQ
jgi:hypothetical protein